MNRYTKLALILAASMVVGFGIFMLFQNSKFRLVGSVPGLDGVIPTSTGTLKLDFNREIDTSIEYTDFLDGDISIITNFVVEGKTIFISLAPLTEDTDYEFVLKKIQSNDGESIDSIPVRFTAKYVPFDQISPEQKKLEINQTDKNNKEDPLAVHLPFEGDRFYIKGEYTSTDTGEPIFVVDAQLFLSRADLGSGRDVAIEKYKKKVIDFIKSKGFDPDKYLVRYDINEPPSTTN